MFCEICGKVIEGEAKTLHLQSPTANELLGWDLCYACWLDCMHMMIQAEKNKGFVYNPWKVWKVQNRKRLNVQNRYLQLFVQKTVFLLYLYRNTIDIY